MWRIGFYVQEMRGEIQESLQREIVSVFIPNTPNPTSGFIVFFPKNEVIELEMPVEDALNMVLSGGTVLPKKKVPKHMMLTREQLETLNKEAEEKPE